MPILKTDTIQESTAATGVTLGHAATCSSNLTVTGTTTLNGDVVIGVDKLDGNMIDGGTYSDFASQGIDDNATSTKLAIADGAGSEVTATGYINATGGYKIAGVDVVSLFPCMWARGQVTVTYAGTTGVVTLSSLTCPLTTNASGGTVDIGTAAISTDGVNSNRLTLPYGSTKTTGSDAMPMMIFDSTGGKVIDITWTTVDTSGVIVQFNTNTALEGTAITVKFGLWVVAP